jgi:hypothetical protein
MHKPLKKPIAFTTSPFTYQQNVQKLDNKGKVASIPTTLSQMIKVRLNL